MKARRVFVHSEIWVCGSRFSRESCLRWASGPGHSFARRRVETIDMPTMEIRNIEEIRPLSSGSSERCSGAVVNSQHIFSEFLCDSDFYQAG